MTTSESSLIKLIEIIRKDSNINNALDAMEQLSLFLLLKYFYESIALKVPKGKSIPSFISFYETTGSVYKSKATVDFSKLQNILINIFHDMSRNILETLEIDSTTLNFKKIENIFNNIPLRISSDKILKILISGLNHIDLNDELTEAYDAIVVKMINDSVSAGEFYTPKSIVKSIVNVVKPECNQTIYDPALGTGRFLVEAKRSISKNSPSEALSSIRLSGSDVSSFANLVGSLNLLLNGVNIEHVNLENSLLNEEGIFFDCILSAIPFGKVIDHEKYERLYPQNPSSLEVMFINHVMQKLSNGGKAALIVPEGVLFNSSKGFVQLRKELLLKFNLHSILSLPPGALAPYSGLKVSVLFFDKVDPGKEVWFYQIKTDKPLNKSNKINESDFEEFIDLFEKRTVTRRSCLVNKKTILKSKGLSLLVELPQKSDYLKKVESSEVISYLVNEKAEYDSLFPPFIDSLKEKVKVKFINKYSIEELFKTRAGKTLNKKEVFEEGKFPVYGGNGKIGYSNEFNRTGENILIGRVGAYCGNVHYVDGPIWLTNNSFSVEIIDDSIVYKPYLVHVLRKLKLNKFARGSAQPSISYGKIKDIELELPSYEQQILLSNWFDKMRKQSEILIEQLGKQNVAISEVLDNLILNSVINNSIGEKS